MKWGQHGADEPPDGRPVGEDADDVSTPPDLLVQPLQRVVGPDLAPVSDRKGGEGEDVRASLVQERRCLWEALHELLHHALVLGVDLDRRGLLVDGPHHCRHRRLCPLRHPAQEVGHEVGAAALPGRPGEDRGDRLLEPPVGV